jgi:preprotein translocase subunit SecD
MKKKHSGIRLLVWLLVILIAGAVFFTGIPFSKVFGVYDLKPTSELINYGLDLTGGVYIVLQADESDGEDVTSDTLEKAIAIIRTRIDSLGVSEPEISQQGTDQIRVSIPDVADQQEAIDLIGQTAQLQFLDPDGNVILTGSNIESSSYTLYTDDSGVSSPAVKLTFDDEGTELFAEATEEFEGDVITIMLDDEEISAPTVSAVITDGEAYITNIGSKDEAINLATLIRAGALPVDFEIVQVETIGPTLGQDSLSKGFIGGIVGAILVLLFMLLIYKGPGLAADLALIVYILLYLYFMAFLGVTLTLPGIAGIILSIGMAVDANIIIFERIKEELRLGKSILSSIEAGFSRAIRTIIDANITTMIAGCALFFFGSGSIRGFALTLMLGVLVSMITAVFVTKKLLKLMIGAFKVNSPSFFGIKGVE